MKSPLVAPEVLRIRREDFEHLSVLREIGDHGDLD